MPRQKIVLFLVEGISDQTALGAIISKLLTTEEVRFDVFNCDITSERGSSPNNIVKKIGNKVKEYSIKYTFQQNDYLEVVHLIDMDGAYIPYTRVEDNLGQAKRVLYFDDRIVAYDKNGIIQRNDKKRANINRIIGNPFVWGTIPYSVYFFSSNLDHVIHGNANLEDNEKYNMAIQFVMKYKSDTKKFIEFISNKDISTGDDYNASWDLIREGINSLKRGTNLNIYFSEKAIRIPRNFSTWK